MSKVIEDITAREIAVRAFEHGFAIGANARKEARRHTVEPSTHEHWRAGFEAGRAAVDAASSAYRHALKSKDAR